MTGRAAAVVAALLGLAPTVAAQEGDCLSEVRLEGPGAARSALLAELQPGLLSGTPTGPCAGARVAIAPDGEGYWLRLEQGDRAIERHAATVEAAAVWVESWLAPAYASDPESANDAAAAQAIAAVAESPLPHVPATTIDAAAGPSEDDGDDAQPAEPAGPEPPSVVLQTSYVWTIDNERQFWVGPALDLHFAIGRSLWIGLALQASFQVGDARGVDPTGTKREMACTNGRCTDVRMYNLAAVARFGGRLTRERYYIHGGLGFGSAGGAGSMRHDALRHIDEDGEEEYTRVGDDEVGPVAELFAEAGVRLGRGFHLVVAASGRFHLNEGRDWDDAPTLPGPGCAGEPTGGMPMDYACRVLPPNPMPRFMLGTHVGIAWAFGGDR